MTPEKLNRLPQRDQQADASEIRVLNAQVKQLLGALGERDQEIKNLKLSRRYWLRQACDYLEELARLEMEGGGE